MTRVLCKVQGAVILVMVIVLSTLLMPASACGCGAYIPSEGSARVTEERALIRWDGRTEDIVMGLSVGGESEEAAWILPVPARATVKLADPKLFEELENLTRPLPRRQWLPTLSFGGGSEEPGGAAGPVTILERQALGPFDVSTLAANDAQALSDWLSSNGYGFPDGLSAILQTYVEQGWYYVAVRLSPGTGEDTLGGRLDPLWVTFPSESIVYPMRASALSRSDLRALIYVLADHRVEEPVSSGELSTAEGFDPETGVWGRVRLLRFADWLEPTSLSSTSAIAPFVGHRLFLTKFDIHITDPASIKDDFLFRLADRDDTYRETFPVYVGAGGTWLFLFVTLVLGPITLILLTRLGARRLGLVTPEGGWVDDAVRNTAMMVGLTIYTLLLMRLSTTSFAHTPLILLPWAACVLLGVAAVFRGMGQLLQRSTRRRTRARKQAAAVSIGVGLAVPVLATLWMTRALG